MCSSCPGRTRNRTAWRRLRCCRRGRHRPSRSTAAAASASTDTARPTSISTPNASTPRDRTEASTAGDQPPLLIIGQDDRQPGARETLGQHRPSAARPTRGDSDLSPLKFHVRPTSIRPPTVPPRLDDHRDVLRRGGVAVGGHRATTGDTHPRRRNDNVITEMKQFEGAASAARVAGLGGGRRLHTRLGARARGAAEQAVRGVRLTPPACDWHRSRMRRHTL
jgi:hypothetical protein